MAGLVSRTDGGITYVDVAFALKNHIKFAAVRNAAGKFLFPSLRRIQAAAAAFTKVPATNEMHIVNPPKSAPLAYPISTYTYVIVPQQTSHAAELRKLIFWALTQGQKSQYTAKLLFVAAAEAGARRVREDAEDDPHLGDGQGEGAARSRGPLHAWSGPQRVACRRRPRRCA